MISARMFQCDAFTTHLFAGNPGAVVVLDTWPDEKIMQAVAAENNLAETAFIVRNGADWDIRYFTPKAEIDLCGHATLCTAHVIFHQLNHDAASITLHTHLAGDVQIARDSPARYVMNLPSWPPGPITPDEHRELMACLKLGVRDVLATGKHRDYLVVVQNQDIVKNMKPDFVRMRDLKLFVCVTAATDDGHFVSRFFTPTDGIDEDPVTGSAHCMLVPFWTEQLGKNDFIARQLSERGGTLYCTMLGDRVQIAGDVVTFFETTLTLPS